MMKKSNKLRNVNDEEFKEIYNRCNSYAEICRCFNLREQGSNYNTIKKIAKSLNLPEIKYDFKSDEHVNKFRKKESPLHSILTQNSNYQSNLLKKRLLKEGLIEYKCHRCGLRDKWMDESLVLQLDHINGIHTDNRLENLRLLCPNCHSQTPTYSNRQTKEIIYCNNCKNPFAGFGKICQSCYKNWEALKGTEFEIQRQKINWPTPEFILEELKGKSYTELSKQLGISDNAIRKFLRKNNINPPKRKGCG